MLERRLQNRVRPLQSATRPDGMVHGGPDRATVDPGVVNEISAMYGSPDGIVQRLEALGKAGGGYVLLNGGGAYQRQLSLGPVPSLGGTAR